MAVDKPDTTRVWASAAPPADIEDPDISSPGKVEAGYRDEIPVYQHHNWIFNEASKSAKYLNEQGIGIWDSVTTFPVGSIVKGSDLNLYQAIVEQSNNDPVGDKTNWKPFVTSTTVGGRKNLLENAEFRIWQEGNSFSIASTEAKYTADRFIVYSLNGTTQVNRVGASKFPSYSNDIVGGLQLLPQGGVSDFDVSIRLDSVTSYILAGKSATVSAIVNSNEAAVLKVQYLTPDATDDWSTFTFRGEVSINLSVGDNKIEALFNNIDSSVSRGAAIVFKFDSFTAGFFDAAIALTQLEVGTVATDFEYVPFADDFARCQRYFEVDDASTGNPSFYQGDITAGFFYKCFTSFAVKKRIVPTMVLSAVNNVLFPATPGTLEIELSGFSERRLSNGSGVGEFSSFWTADARL
jgi:hypothetical protein